MKLQVPRRIVAGFVSAAIILGGAGVLFLHVAMRFRENGQSVARSHETIETLQDLSNTFENAATGARTFILNGNAANLAPLNYAVSREPAIFAKLSSLMTGNSSQQDRLSKLQPQVEAGLQTLQHLVTLRQQQGMLAVLMQVTPAANSKAQENIRRAVSDIRDEENRLLEQRERNYDASVRLASELFAAAIVTQFVLLLLICIVFLRDASFRAQAGAALSASETKLKEALEREKNAARVDFLTGILNRRGFYEIAARESQRARRYHRPVTLVYFDLDNFKSVNDSLGHDTGDELLIKVAAAISSTVRGTDIVARLGGDEFVVLLPETHQEQGMTVVRKVQTQLLEVMKQENWPVTFSIGVTSFHTAPESVEEMIHCADQVMYSVKQTGKNSVAVHTVVDAVRLQSSSSSQQQC